MNTIHFPKLRNVLEDELRRRVLEVSKFAKNWSMPKLLDVCSKMLDPAALVIDLSGELHKYQRLHGNEVSGDLSDFQPGLGYGKHSEFVSQLYDSSTCRYVFSDNSLLHKVALFFPELEGEAQIAIKRIDRDTEPNLDKAERGKLNNQKQKLNDAVSIIDHLLLAWNKFYKAARAIDVHTGLPRFDYFEDAALSLMEILKIPRRRSGMPELARTAHEAEPYMEEAYRMDPNKEMTATTLAKILENEFGGKFKEGTMRGRLTRDGWNPREV